MRTFRYLACWFVLTQIGYAAMPDGAMWRRMVAAAAFVVASLIWTNWLNTEEAQ